MKLLLKIHYINNFYTSAADPTWPRNYMVNLDVTRQQTDWGLHRQVRTCARPQLAAMAVMGAMGAVKKTARRGGRKTATPNKNQPRAQPRAFNASAGL